MTNNYNALAAKISGLLIGMALFFWVLPCRMRLHQRRNRRGPTSLKSLMLQASLASVRSAAAFDSLPL